MKTVHRYIDRGRILLAIAFVMGATVLAVEVMATRILSPYFGNSIFSISSVLSVVLGALSLGYWYGGRMADRDPSWATFFSILTYAGMGLFCIEILRIIVLPLGTLLFSVMTGPFITALVLFFLPSMAFGCLSPYAVKLYAQARPKNGIGTASGTVFFWSTMGSIVGSLGAGFFLVPVVGITTSLLILATLITGIGIIGEATERRNYGRLVGAVFLAIATLAILGLGRAHEESMGDVVFVKDGVYERIAVVDSNMVDNVPGRLLLLDRHVSSGIKLPSGDPLFGYHAFARVYEMFTSHPARIAILGAGTGNIASLYHAHEPEAVIEVVDIEPLLEELMYTYFMVDPTPTIRFHVDDGRRFLAQEDEPFDVIYADMYSSLYAQPSHTTTEEFYTLAYESLSEGGVFIANHIGSTDTSLTPSSFLATWKTMDAVFDSVHAYGVTSSSTKELQNITFVGTKGVGTPDRSDTALEELLEAHQITEPPAEELAREAVLTDNKPRNDLLMIPLLALLRH